MRHNEYNIYTSWAALSLYIYTECIVARKAISRFNEYQYTYQWRSQVEITTEARYVRAKRAANFKYSLGCAVHRAAEGGDSVQLLMVTLAIRVGNVFKWFQCKLVLVLSLHGCGSSTRYNSQPFMLFSSSNTPKKHWRPDRHLPTFLRWWTWYKKVNDNERVSLSSKYIYFRTWPVIS